MAGVEVLTLAEPHQFLNPLSRELDHEAALRVHHGEDPTVELERGGAKPFSSVGDPPLAAELLYDGREPWVQLTRARRRFPRLAGPRPSFLHRAPPRHRVFPSDSWLLSATSCPAVPGRHCGPGEIPEFDHKIRMVSQRRSA